MKVVTPSNLAKFGGQPVRRLFTIGLVIYQDPLAYLLA
jgi:hypothetical protein